MDTDERVRDLLREATPHPGFGIDVEAIRDGARRRATRRTTLAAGFAVVAAGAAGIWETRGSSQRPSPAPRPTPSQAAWQQVTAMPLSPRWDMLTVWTGSEVLVVGGQSRDFVGGPAPFPQFTDGGAFDPESRTWRPIADSPFALGSRSYGANLVVTGTVVVAELNKLVAYDIAGDSWHTLPAPPRDIPQPVLAADARAGLVYAVDRYVQEGDGAPVQVLDLRAGTWSALPLSTHEPRLDSRSLVMTDVGLVVVGDGVYPRQVTDGQQENSRAELWDGTSWTRFPDSTVNGGEWHWTGERVVSTYLVTEAESNADGRHQFRAGALDPSTGTWSQLPWLPGRDLGLINAGWPPTDGERVLVDGYLYDDASRTFRPIPAPAGAQDPGVVLGGDQVLAFGGYQVDPGQQPSRVTNVTPTSAAWVLDLG